MLDKKFLEDLKVYIEKYKFVFYDEASGQLMLSNHESCKKEVILSKEYGFNFKVVDKKYLITNGLNLDRSILNLIHCIQDRRILEVNYEEYLRLSEFFFMHDTEFKVTNVKSDQDKLVLHLL